MFHTLKSILKKYYKRVRAIIRYIIDYKVLLFSLVYILFSSLMFKILRNNERGGTIGLILFVVVVLSLFSVILLNLRNKRKVPKQRREEERGMSISVQIITYTLCLSMTALISFLRVKPILSSIDIVNKRIGSFTNQKVSFEGYVSEEIDKRHRYSHLVVRQLEDISVNNQILSKNHGNILVKVENYEKFTVGQVCNFSGLLVEPENFEDFDYKGYLQNKGIFLILEDPRLVCWNISDRRGGMGVRKFLIDLKDNIIKKIDITLSEPQSSLLAGILFGKKRLFSNSFDESIRKSGVSHIVAASGYNITILVILTNKLLFFLPKKMKIVLGLLIIWLFALFSGLSSSIVRACIMSSLSLSALLFGRNNTIHISLPLASALFVFFSPLIIYDVGFLLSISATLGLVYISPVIMALKEKLTTKLSFLNEYVIPTMSCTLSTLPISLITFKTFSVWSIPVNALILPVIESTMLWGALSILLMNIHKPLSYLFFSIVNLQLRYFEYIVEIVGKLNWGSWEISNTYSIFFAILLISTVILFVIYHYPVENEKYNYYIKDH